MKKPLAPKYKALIYPDGEGCFRLKITHRNGKILFVSSESYKRRQTLTRVFRNFIKDITERGITQI
jgi:uncharacterized protein YegP (UPF0339 family)